MTVWEVAQEKDEAAVIALWEAAGLLRPWNDPHVDFLRAVRSEQSAVLLIRGQVSHGQADYESAAPVLAAVMVADDGHRGWVYYVATDPARRGEGLGRTVMDAAEAWLRARGVQKLNLMVRCDNDPVKSFYERLGYEPAPVDCFSKPLEGKA